jgi:hypothetical protein
VRDSFLQTELVDDALALVLDVEEADSSVPREGDEEGEVAVSDELVAGIDLPALALGKNLHGRSARVERESLALAVGHRPRAIDAFVASVGLERGGVEGREEGGRAAVVDASVKPSDELPVCEFGTISDDLSPEPPSPNR